MRCRLVVGLVLAVLVAACGEAPPEAEPVIEVTVLGPEGAPLHAGTLYVGRGDTKEHLWAGPVMAGSCNVPLRELGSGPYWVQIALVEPLDVRTRFEDLDPAERQVQIKLPYDLEVGGRVVDAKGNGVAGAWVWVARADSIHGVSSPDQIDSQWATSSGYDERRQTDTGGAFLLDDVQLGPGRAVIAVNPGPGWVPPPWTMARAGDRDVEIVVRRGSEVSGRVYDHTGKPLPGVVVGAQWEEAETIQVRNASLASQRLATTDSGGVWRLQGVPGDRDLTVWVRSVPDPEGAQKDYIGIAPDWRPIRLRAPAAGVDIRLQKGYHIEGTVVDEDGDPLGAHVHIATHGLSNLDAYTKDVDGQQRFQLPLVPPGRYVVRAESSRGGEAGVGVATAHVPGKPVVVRVAFHPPLRMRFSIQGVDRAGFLLGGGRFGEPQEVNPELTDYDWESRFDDPRTLYVWHPEDDRCALLLNARPSGSPHFLHLQVGLSISGRLGEIDGPPASRRVVFAYHLAHHEMRMREVVAAPDGTFRIRGLPSGMYKVYARVLTGSGLQHAQTQVLSLAAGSKDVVLKWNQ